MKRVPVAQKLLLQNRDVRVWEMVLRPGEIYPMHRHRYPYLSIMLEDASVVMTDAAGREEPLRLRKGDFVWRTPPDDHAVRNVGRTKFRNRLVEILR